MHSQNNEEEHILGYFKKKETIGTVLDIGANDGRTFSNSLALIELGWNGVLIEPDKAAFNKLTALHKGNDKVLCYNFALADRDGECNFYKSGSHINNNDTGLLSTTCEADYAKWKGTTEFIQTKVETLSFKSFLEICPIKTFDFISIDAEGQDWTILSQIELTDIGCQIFCVEHNGIETDKYIEYGESFGFHRVCLNAENLIMVLI